MGRQASAKRAGIGLLLLVCTACGPEGEIRLEEQGVREDYLWQGSIPACKITVLLTNHTAHAVERIDYAFSYIDLSVAAQPLVQHQTEFEHVAAGQVAMRAGPLQVPCQYVGSWQVDAVRACRLANGQDCSGIVKF